MTRMEDEQRTNYEEALSFAESADASHDYRAMSIAWGILALVDELKEHRQPSEPAGMPVYMANEILEDSWLNEARFARERAALGYAAIETRAIPGLSKMTAEEAYFVFNAMERGAAVYDAKVAKHE